MRRIWLVLLLPSQLLAGHGTVLFNQAYKMEEANPQGAVEVYREALAAGLTNDLARAAHWRLFFIFKDRESYADALRECDYLAPTARQQIVDVIRERHDLKNETLERYVESLRGLVSGDREKRKAAGRELTKVYASAPRSLRKRILLDLSENGASESALTLAQQGDGTPEAKLGECDLLIYLGKTAEAEKLLRTMYESSDYSTSEKMRIVYLLGRARRDSGGDIEMFRVAEEYADGDERMRMRALAAYGLLRQGYLLQARGMMRGLSSSKDPDVQLLDLLLRAEVDGEKKALRDLQNRRDSLKGAVRKHRDAYLAQRALRLLGEH